jgi:hypothetical protein
MARDRNRLTILFGAAQRLQSFTELNSVSDAGVMVRLADHVKILSITLDNRQTVDKHVADVCQSCFYLIHLIRPALTGNTVRTVACTLICTCFDCATLLLYGVPQFYFNRLQRVAVCRSQLHV